MFFWITGHQYTTSDLVGILDSVNTCWWNRLGYSSWNTHQGLHIGHCISTCSFSYSIYPFFLHRLQLERTIRSPRPTMHPQIAMHKSLVCSIDTVFFHDLQTDKHLMYTLCYITHLLIDIHGDLWLLYLQRQTYAYHTKATFCHAGCHSSYDTHTWGQLG